MTILGQFSFNFMEASFMKFNKKSIFQNFISQTLELRTVKQRHPYFLTRLERLLPICDRRWIAGVCCPNQIKNHHFVICRALTSYLSLNFIVTYSHAELQSPRGRRFCLLCWSTFYGTIQGYTKRGSIKCPEGMWGPEDLFFTPLL